MYIIGCEYKKRRSKILIFRNYFLVGDLVILAVFFGFAVSFNVRYPMLTQDFYAY